MFYFGKRLKLTPDLKRLELQPAFLSSQKPGEERRVGL